MSDQIFFKKILTKNLLFFLSNYSGMWYNNFDLTPKGIIQNLNLKRPIYRQTSTYGHFGRNDLDLPWEKLDKVAVLKKYL